MENKKYSLLVVALYCYAGHVKEMVKHLKEKNPLVDITILTEEPDTNLLKFVSITYPLLIGLSYVV